MVECIKVRGHVFEIFTSGDWGGRSEVDAIATVIRTLQTMKLAALVVLHDALLDEHARRVFEPSADAAICDPIVTTFANPPEDDRNYGAALHITAHARSR